MFTVGTKLHLGAGGKAINGYVNTDRELSRSPSGVVVDVMKLDLPPLTFAEIYASHLLEHLWFEDTERVLCHWRDALLPGGTLRISVPDIRLIVKNCVDSHAFGPDPNAPLFGWYNRDAPEWERHKQAFWAERLAELFKKTGFSQYRPWRVEHEPAIAAVHDWASYETISLNMLGIR